MKKSVVFLGFYLWGAYGANAESLDGFFQDQAPSAQPSSQNTASEDAPKNEVNSGPTVIKPQVLYLEDLNPPEKPKANPPAAASAPVVKAAKAKAPSKPEPQTTPVALPAPLPTAKPTAGAASAAGKIKKEPLPKTIAQTPKAAPVPPAAAAAPAAPVVQKSFIQNRSARAEETQNNLPESSQTLSSFQEQRQGQYAPFATQTSRQQAAHSLVTQAKNEGRTYPAGLDPFVIEFDQTFAVLSPNRAIRDLYKTATITLPTMEEASPLSFNATMPAAPVVTLATPAPVQAVTAPEPEIEKTPETQAVTTPETNTAQQQEQTPSPTEPTNTLALDNAPADQHQEQMASQVNTAPQPELAPSPEPTNTLVLNDTPAVQNAVPHDASERASDRDSSPLATVMVPETAQALDPASQNLLDQVAAAYHEGSLRVIQITGYVNTRSGQNEDVRGYTHIQSLGRRGAAMVVDYLKGKNVPESAMAYRIIPTSTIALQNPFYASLSTENTLRLDVAGGRS